MSSATFPVRGRALYMWGGDSTIIKCGKFGNNRLPAPLTLQPDCIPAPNPIASRAEQIGNLNLACRRNHGHHVNPTNHYQNKVWHWGTPCLLKPCACEACNYVFRHEYPQQSVTVTSRVEFNLSEEGETNLNQLTQLAACCVPWLAISNLISPSWKQMCLAEII